MQISTVQLVAMELPAFHVPSQMHQLERHINPAGMGGEGSLQFAFSYISVFLPQLFAVISLLLLLLLLFLKPIVKSKSR